jgi:hypothetical protein
MKSVDIREETLKLKKACFDSVTGLFGYGPYARASETVRAQFRGTLGLR